MRWQGSWDKGGNVHEDSSAPQRLVCRAWPRPSEISMPIQQVYLVRHGETEWSLSGQHTGITDIPLTENGRRVAQRLEPVLATEPFVLVLTSPLQRARKTCELAGLGERAEIDRNLMEWNYGEYEGLTPRQIRAKSPGWMLFSDGCPGGETSRADWRPSRSGDCKSPRGGRACRPLCARACLKSLCGSVAWTSACGGLSLPSRYGNAKHPELLPKHPRSEAVERHAHGVASLRSLCFQA